MQETGYRWGRWSCLVGSDKADFGYGKTGGRLRAGIIKGFERFEAKAVMLVELILLNLKNERSNLFSKLSVIVCRIVGRLQLKKCY